MKFTKKAISIILSLVMLLSITAGIDLSAYAAGWADNAENIQFNTIYTAESSKTDAGEHINDMGVTIDRYFDAFKFTVPSKGKVILNIEADSKYYFPLSYESRIDYLIYNSKNIDKEYEVDYTKIESGFSAARGMYYGKYEWTLPAGTYFLLFQYDYNPYWGFSQEGSCQFSLSHKPSVATPKLKAAVNANGSFKLTWNKVSGAEKYELYIKQADGSYKLMKTTTGTAFTTAVGAYGYQYTYKMRAVKGIAKSAYSSAVNAKNTKKLQAPTAKATVNANGSFKISWNKVAGAAKYGIYIKQADGTYKWMKTVTGTSFTTAVAAYGKQYSYKVLAATENNKSANTFSNVVNAKNTKKLQTPTLKAAVNKNGSFKLSWNKVTGAEKYELYIKQANGSYKLMKTTTGTSFTTAVAAKGKTYSYKVRAVTGKNKNAASNYSNAVNAKRK